MRLALLSALALATASSFGQLLLQTGFEPAQGFVAGPLDGQGGWTDNTTAGTISDTFSSGGVQSAVVPVTNAGLSGAFGPGFSFDPFSTTNQWLRIEWSQFSRFLNRRSGADTATTVGFEIRSGGTVVAGIQVDDSNDIVSVYDASLPGYVETSAVAPRESWVGFQMFLDPIGQCVTYAMERTPLAVNFLSGPVLGPLDSFRFQLSDTGFEHIYVDDVSIRAVPNRTMTINSVSSVAPSMTNLPHAIKVQDPSTGQVLLLTSVTPSSTSMLSVALPDVSVPVTTRVKPRGHLSRLVRGIPAGSTAHQLLAETYIAGDVTNDDIIDIGDYTELSFDFGKTVLHPDWDIPRANGVRVSDSDITRDGLIDIADYVQLAYAFGQYGELP